jgi:hypothetical protein
MITSFSEIGTIYFKFGDYVLLGTDPQQLSHLFEGRGLVKILLKYDGEEIVQL